MLERFNMRPYARSHKVGIARDVHNCIGFTDRLTKQGLAAKKPTKHGARQEAKMAIKKDSWEAVFGHLGTPEEVADEWLKMQEEIAKLREELAVCKLQEKVREAGSNTRLERVSARVEALKGQVGRPCSTCRHGTMFLDSNGYSYFLRCNTCHHVPMS